MGDLQGRTTVLTGDSTGIGDPVARALDGQGVNLGMGSGTIDDPGIADLVEFVAGHSRLHRILEISLRPVSDPTVGWRKR